MRFDLEFNGLADSRGWPEVEPPAPDGLNEVIISRRFKSLKEERAPRDQCELQELEMYLRQVAAVGGNLAEAARQLKIKRTTLHMRIKRLQRSDG